MASIFILGFFGLFLIGFVLAVSLIVQFSCKLFNQIKGGYREAVYEETPEVVENDSSEPITTSANPFSAPQTQTKRRLLTQGTGVPGPGFLKAFGMACCLTLIVIGWLAISRFVLVYPSNSEASVQMSFVSILAILELIFFVGCCLLVAGWLPTSFKNSTGVSCLITLGTNLIGGIVGFLGYSAYIGLSALDIFSA